MTSKSQISRIVLALGWETHFDPKAMQTTKVQIKIDTSAALIPFDADTRKL